MKEYTLKKLTRLPRWFDKHILVLLDTIEAMTITEDRGNRSAPKTGK